MTWLDMANLLFDQSQALSPRGAHVHLDTAGWLRTWTPHQNQVADFGARHFAKHVEWPPLEPEVACQLYFRCLFAIESCIEFQSRGLKGPTSPEKQQQALESLLVKSWHLEAIEWAQRRYALKPDGRGRAFAYAAPRRGE